MAYLGKVFSLLLLALLFGCGYRPVGSAPPAGLAERPAIAIPLFKNRSTEVDLEAVFANAFVTTFSQHRAWRITPREQEADLVLEGTVSSVEYSSVAFVNVDRSVVRRVTIRVDVSLKRRETGKVVWKDSQVLMDDYPLENNNYHIGEATKAMGIRRGPATLSRRIMDKVMLVL